MITITNNMIAPCGNLERKIMEMYVEQANGINNNSDWHLLDEIKAEIARRFPNQSVVINAVHRKSMSLYHEEEYYAGLL